LVDAQRIRGHVAQAPASDVAALRATCRLRSIRGGFVINSQCRRRRCHSHVRCAPADHPQRETGQAGGSMRRFVKDYSLSLVLAGLFLLSLLIQTVAGWYIYASDQQDHGQVATLFGDSGYIWDWAEATFENWQSEFLQLFSFVVLSAFLIHRHSHESRDDQDELKKQVEQVLADLKERD
jgi:hypothetical protein